MTNMSISLQSNKIYYFSLYNNNIYVFIKINIFDFYSSKKKKYKKKLL